MVVAWTRVQAAEVMGSGQLPETGGRWSQQGPLTEKWKQLGSICVFGSQESLRRATSLVVQWLRILLAVQGTQVRSLVGELRSHMQHPRVTTKATKTQHSQIN